MGVAFGSGNSSDLAIADHREWLVTNGLGSYASGSVGGTLTRSYHGLLISALNVPVDRTLLAAKTDKLVKSLMGKRLINQGATLHRLGLWLKCCGPGSNMLIRLDRDRKTT